MQSFPQTIHVGMKVFDNAHHEIGHVKDLRFPENAIDPQVETATLYALPSQIASATGDEVVLNVGKDELITRH